MSDINNTALEGLADPNTHMLDFFRTTRLHCDTWSWVSTLNDNTPMSRYHTHTALRAAGFVSGSTMAEDIHLLGPAYPGGTRAFKQAARSRMRKESDGFMCMLGNEWHGLVNPHRDDLASLCQDKSFIVYDDCMLHVKLGTLK